ncbi:MAG TPA: cytochrome P450, partial [Pseudonocardiaceae bacterium]
MAAGHAEGSPAKEDSVGGRCPFVLDPEGRDIHAEATELRKQGPATRIELPSGVEVWSINDFEHVRDVLRDPRVTKSARDHWPAFINNEIPG